MVRREWECSSCRSFCPVIEFRGAFREYGGRKKGRARQGQAWDSNKQIGLLKYYPPKNDLGGEIKK
jgi:hypothetical protein